MRTRVLTTIVLAATLLVCAIFRLWSSNAAAAMAEDHSAAPERDAVTRFAPGDAVEPRQSRAPKPHLSVAVPVRAPEPEERAAARRFPSSLAEARLTPQQQALLSNLTPLQRSLYDYKLGLLARARPCVEKLGPVRGTLSVFFHFSVDSATGVGRGTSSDVLDSNLDSVLDQRALACLKGAHAEAEASFDPSVGDGAFHWNSEIAIPLDEDPAYELFTLSAETGEPEDEE